MCATSCCAAIILQAPEAGADLKKIETILDGTAPPAEKKVFWTTSLDHTCARGCSSVPAAARDVTRSRHRARLFVGNAGVD